MTEANVPTAAAIESRLREALSPTQLEVIDESAAHAGHSGANGLGFGTHFPGAHRRACIRRPEPGRAAPPCV